MGKSYRDLLMELETQILIAERLCYMTRWKPLKCLKMLPRLERF